MKSSSIVAAAFFLLSVPWAISQSQPPAEDNHTTNSTPASATAAADKTTFYILGEVTQDVIWKGKILIPVESKIVGHVTEASARTAEDHESRLGIVFDKVIVKHNHELDFTGVIQSLDAPAQRKSKVDEPDQMLPPSVMGVSQSGGMGPMGGSPSRSSSGASSGSGGMVMNMPTGAPIYMEGTPGSNPGNSAGGNMRGPSGGQPANKPAAATPLSAGMPLGIFRIKGLNLIPGPTSSTPGPVITSSVRDVKLDYGTQVLVKATDPRISKP